MSNPARERLAAALAEFESWHVSLKALPRTQRELEGRAARLAAEQTREVCSRASTIVRRGQMSEIRAAQAGMALRAAKPRVQAAAREQATANAAYGKNRVVRQLQMMGRSETYPPLTREDVSRSFEIADAAAERYVEGLATTLQAVLEAGTTAEEVSRLCARKAASFARELTNRARSEQEYRTGMGLAARWRWVDCDDNRVRATHREVNGEEVIAGERFSNGLRYPKDPDGAREETEGCRCRLEVVA